MDQTEPVRYHKVPVYCCMPSSTLDLSCKTGADIVIEERDASEVTMVATTESCWSLLCLSRLTASSSALTALRLATLLLMLRRLSSLPPSLLSERKRWVLSPVL